MWNYYIQLGVKSLRRNPILTALMVLTLAVGVAASVSTLTILHVMSGNPIPHKSSRLLSPMIDNGSMERYTPGALPQDQQLSYPDAMNLLRDKPDNSGKPGMPGLQGVVRRTALFGIDGSVEPVRPGLPVLEVDGLAVTSAYFTMFEVPFLYGASWNESEDSGSANVIVLGRKQSEIMFGKENPVGKRIRYHDNEFQIVGVRDTWDQTPRYTHLINGNGGSFKGEDGIYIPLATAIRLQINTSGNMWCSQPREAGYQGTLNSECTWMQFWYEVKSEADIAPLKSYLDSYANEQKKLGRIPRPNAAKLYDVMQWMEYLEVVHTDSKLAVWLSFGFLLLCLINTVGLLLAKFSARASDVGVRRALGASKAEIFKQFLVETGVVGLSGGLLGLPLSFLAMGFIAVGSAGLASVPPMDWYMLGITIMISVGGSLIAGLLPIWRACQVTPALQLKSQ